MFIFTKKKLFSNKNFLVLCLGLIFLFSPSVKYLFSMIAPDIVFNGDSFTPECDSAAVYFDVPGIYPPLNCGESISLPTIPSGEIYEIRDLDENLNYISSYWTISAVGSAGLGGCIDTDAINFNPEATYDDGDCEYEIIGCMSEDAINYDPSATIDDGSCLYDNGEGEIPTAPISAPSTVYNGASFTPVCGTGVIYFDSPNAFAPMNCGDSVTFGNVSATYELRGLDESLNVIEPTIFITSVYNAGGGAVVDTPRKRIIQKFPVIEIFSPLLNSFFSNILKIDYKATDPNDLGTSEEKTGHGLSKNPVSIFYTDKSFEWLNLPGVLVESEFKNIIAEGLPAIGKYEWSVKDLEPGILYRIIIDAQDNSGWIGEAVSGYFSVDFTAPVFKIKTDPVLVRKGEVKIFAESSEDLNKSPILKITQRGAEPFILEMVGEKDYYEGVYNVSDGFDGTAKIEIEGEDLAGNIGTEIISGGTFSVGVKPPPKPILVSEIEKVVYEEFINIRGIVREDTEVILSINGTTTFTIKPNTKGEFIIDKIKLDKIKNRGVNYINISSKDVFNNISEPISLEVKYNIKPTVFITKPIDGNILSNKTEILAKGSDENLDILFYKYEIIPSSEYNLNGSNSVWDTISENVPGGNFIFDTTEYDDGEYMIRVTVYDGEATATSLPVLVKFKNTLPYVRFENGRKTITKESSIILKGKAFVPESINATIKAISYSLDNGQKWIPIKVDPDNAVREQEISLVLNNLKEGSNNILWLIKDSRDFIGRANHLVVVDNTAPKAPLVKSPRNNITITDDNDQNTKREGVQINIKGNAEPNSEISLSINNNILKTKVLATGDFSFFDITLQKGENKLIFISTDEALNKSKETIINVIYNNLPTINFINPKPFRGLSGLATLSWEIKDKDGDRISDVEVSYRQGGGTYKILVSNANPKGTYIFDTSNLQESNYYDLKITATDSISKVSSISNFTIDRSLPKITAFDVKSSKIEDKFTFTGIGNARDLISGIEFVEYSIKSENDKERSPWYLGLITKGYLQKQVSFDIKYPKVLNDDSYRVYVRVVDIAGNISEEVYKDFVIDRTPPRVGSFFIMKDNLRLVPDQEGKISFYKNTPFIFSASIENDATSVILKIGNQIYRLERNISTGLWEKEIRLDLDKTEKILITTIDDSYNELIDKEIGEINTIQSGRVIYFDENGITKSVEGLRVRVSKYDDVSGSFKKFNPIFDGVPSVVETDDSGRYELILSAGKYKISFVKSGYKVLKKEIELSKTEIIDYILETKKLSGLEKIISDIFNVWFY